MCGLKWTKYTPHHPHSFHVIAGTPQPPRSLHCAIPHFFAVEQCSVPPIDTATHLSVAGDAPGGEAAGAVSKVRRAGDLRGLAHLHLHHALVPAGDHLRRERGKRGKERERTFFRVNQTVTPSSISPLGLEFTQTRSLNTLPCNITTHPLFSQRS